MVSIKISNRAKIIFLLFIFKAQLIYAATTYTVCADSCNFNNVYEAVEKAKDGDTIEISSSQIIYPQIVIKKSLHIVGKNSPILDGQGKSKMFLVIASDVEISGLVLKNSEVSYLDDVSAIRIESVGNAYIHNNKLVNNAYGIYLAKSHNCRVENNEIIGINKGEAESGNGIHIWSGKNHIIKNNILSLNRDGIYFEFVTDTKIEGNHSFLNSRYGLHFMFSHRNEYRQNRFVNNGSGVAVMYSKSVLMDNNEFSGSLGGASYGLLLKDISLSTIVNNKFINNSVGVFMDGSIRSRFENNLFKKNTRALRIPGNADGNTFYKNVFIQNTFEIASNTSISNNTYEKNYWGKYNGYDIDGDGYGDVPHRPVSISSVLTESVNSSFIFVYSPLFQLLDSIEKALPTYGPENLLDKKPLMLPPAEYL